MRYKERNKELALQCYNYLKSLPDNSEVSTWEIVEKVLKGSDISEIEDELFEVHYYIRFLIGREGLYIMDNSKYRDLCVGLPYNVPYFFRKRYPLGMKIFSKLVEKAEKGDIDEEETNYARIIVYATDYFNHSYDTPIPVKDAYIWLEKAHKKNCRLKVVPNNKYFNGECQQFDGWEYHFELDI